MALEKTPVSWNICGGIATKNAPIMLKPGSALVLDNVRQERLNEWRTRAGNGQSVLDDLPSLNPPVIATEAPWGGLVGLCRKTDAETAGLVYNTTSAPRWTIPPLTFLPNSGGQAQQCSQVNPGIWSRQAIAPATNGAIQQCGLAEGGGYRLSAWWTNVAGNGIQMALTTTSGAVISASSQWGNFPNIIRPRCVYSSAANMLVMVYASSVGGVVSAVRFSTLTGLQVGGTSTLSTNGHVGTGMFLDAIYYGGATITIAFRDNTGADALRIIEYNPSTDVGTEYIPGIGCTGTLSLLPDPDVSGIRMVAVCTVTPEVRVVRLNTVGVIQTNHLAEAVATNAIAGVAYGAGVNWMIVYNGSSGLGPRAVKRRNGTTTSAPAQLGSASAIHGSIFLQSNGWREPGTDPLHYLLCIADADFSQPTYLEMALDYDNASATVVNRWTEPQARLVPLNAQLLTFDQPIQVQRTGTDRFVTCLPRLARFDLPADLTGQQFPSLVIDAWAVQYMNATTYTGQSQGQGCQTQQCAYLPVGSLLQTATGQLLCSHGGSSLPFSPLGVQSTGGGSLTLTKRYSCVVTSTLYDEVGNAWESEPSEAKVVTLTGANNQITWTATNTPFENTARQRTVKWWRTQGDGSEYFLVHEVTDTIANTVSIAFLDQIADTLLSQPISAEVQATITPAFSHVVEFNRRLYGVERDFPTRVRYSKPITPGASPAFPEDFVVDTDDGFGGITGLAAMDDRLVVMKARATYVGDGNARDNAGNGSDPGFTRVSSETGCIVGGPFLSTGAEVYMTSSGGVFRLQRSQEIDFVGSAIDLYLSMPLLQSQETVTGMHLSPQDNEVRIQTTHFRFVHDRVFDIWERDTGGFSLGTVVMTKSLSGGAQQCFFTGDGHLWRESADSTAPDDAGTPYQGVIRSPWVRPTGVGGWMHFYRARAYGTVTATATVAGAELKIFFDDDDTSFETFTPAGNIAATAGLLRIEARPQRGKITSFSLQLKLPSGDATVRLEQWWVLVAPKVGGPPPRAGTRWTGSGASPPSTCPPTGIWPDTLKTWAILPNVANALHGSLAPDQREAFYLLFASLIDVPTLGGKWTIVQGSTAIVLGAPGVNAWPNANAITRPGGSGGVHSWMLLLRSDGVQLLLSITTDAGWLEFSLDVSRGALFSGGGAGVPPTATDQQSILRLSPGAGAQIFGSNATGSDNQYYTHVWQSTDGTCTRVVTFSGANPYMTFGILRATTPDPSWASPIEVDYQVGGANQTSPNTVLSVHNPNGWNDNDFMSGVAPGNFTARISVLPEINDYAAANDMSGKWPLYRSDIRGQTVGSRGVIGVMPDLWWWAGPDGHAFTNVGIYTDGLGHYLLVLNSMVLPWKAGVVPAGVVLATVGPFLGIS